MKPSHLRPRGKFSHHEQCPKCAEQGRDASGDNLAVYVHDDGYNTYCLACGYNELMKERTVKTMRTKETGLKELPVENIVILDGWEEKGIPAWVCEAYGLVLLEDEEDDIIRFPYYKLNTLGIYKLSGYKYRNLDKEERLHQAGKRKKAIWSINGQSNLMFGLNVPGSNKHLIITEGEPDTLSWKTAMQEYTVWGIPGADLTEESLRAHMETILTNYDRIYIAFDDDEPGRNAREIALGMLPALRTYSIEYGGTYKDAGDVLLGEGTKGLRDVFKTATQVRPQDIMDRSVLKERALSLSENRGQLFGVSTGWVELDALIGGWTPGKVVMLSGDTGNGKTTMVLNMAYNAIKEGLRVFFIPLEMTPEQVLLKLVEIHLGRAIISDPSAEQPSVTEKDAAMDYILDNIEFCNKFGGVTTKWLEDTIEIAVSAYRTDLVIFDHITAAVSGGDSGWAEIDTMLYALKAAALQHRITLLVISHINKLGQHKVPTADMLRGSAALKQAVDSVLLVHRYSDHTAMWMGKVDRFIGKRGKVKFDYVDYHFVVSEDDDYDDDDGDDDEEDELVREIIRGPRAPKFDGKKEEEESYLRGGGESKVGVRERRTPTKQRAKI